MSLRVWLPLTKDLRNQGLDDVTVTNNGATFNSAGKLGGCYLFDGSNDYLVGTYTAEAEISFAAWINMPTLPSGRHIFDARTSAGVGYQPMYLNTGSIQVGCSGSGYPSFYYTWAANTWYHVCVTHNTTEVKCYVNGVLIGTSTAGKGVSLGTCNFTLGSRCNQSNYSNVKINDVRIYDHCLSEMEVKQLSQGLILHYPLNRGGWGQENFILESHKVTSGGNASGITRTYESDGSMKIVSTSGNGNWCSLGFAKDSNTSVGNNMAVGDVYCISCDVKIETGTVLPTLFINSGNGYKQLRPVNGSIITGQWMRVYYTSTWANPGTGYGNIQLHLGFSGAVGTYYFKNFKLEKGSIPTPWCPNSSDTLATTMGLNSTTEYDCSGFCNNGIRTGTFSWTSDTPKYAVSQDCLGTNYIYLTPPSTEIQTMAVWVKWNTIPSGQSVILVDNGSGIGLGLYSGGILCSTSGAGSSYAFSKANLVANTWYHFVVVKTGTTTRKLYINGVEQTANSSSSNWSYSVNQLQLGKRSTTSDGFVGKLSDFRAYATALSPSDVKSLYQNCATIDPDGTIRGQIRS